MDVENLDREELEARAARLGVDNPQHKTRRQLIQAIGGSGRSAASRTFEAAKSLFELAATVARTLRPTLPLRPERPPGARPTKPMRPVRPPDERATVSLKTAALKSDRAHASGDGAEPEPTSERLTVSLKPASVNPAALDSVSLNATVMDAAEQSVSSQKATRRTKTPAAGGTPKRARAGRDVDEPVMTQTMARLLDEQGHHRRALAIYEELVRQKPDDTGLKREQEGARERARKRRKPSTSSDESDSDEHGVVALRLDDATALVSWQLDADALSTARDLLNIDAPLVARALVVAPDDILFVHEEVRTERASHEGVWLLRDLPIGAHASVAVGWDLASGFRAHAHAPTLSPLDSPTL